MSGSSMRLEGSLVTRGCHLTTRDNVMENLGYQLAGEKSYMPLADYMHLVQEQPVALWRKRIVKWMWEASTEFEMAINTVACAVNAMDRYLSQHAVSKVALQLLALVSLRVASKMHETQPMTMEETVHMAKFQFSKNQIHQMEKDLLHAIGWHLNPPTAYSIAMRLLCLLENDFEKRRALHSDVLVILKQTMEEHTFSKFRPSTVALAAVEMSSLRKGISIMKHPVMMFLLQDLQWATAQVPICTAAVQSKELTFVTPQVTAAPVLVIKAPIVKPVWTRADSPTSVEEMEKALAPAKPVRMEASPMSIQALEGYRAYKAPKNYPQKRKAPWSEWN